MVMIWKAVIWTVWRQHNKKIFENEVLDLAHLLDDVNTTSWKWWLGRSNVAPVLLYEWISEPVIVYQGDSDYCGICVLVLLRFFLLFSIACFFFLLLPVLFFLFLLLWYVSDHGSICVAWVSCVLLVLRALLI
jgi:hypothetical protein